MKTGHYLISCLFIGLTTSSCFARDITIKTYPLTDKIYEPVDVEEVQVVDDGDISSAIMAGFTVRDLAIVEANISDPGISSIDPFIFKMKKEVGRVGGNGIKYVNNFMHKNPAAVLAVGVKAYRIEWKGKPYIASGRWKFKALFLSLADTRAEAAAKLVKHAHYKRRQEAKVKIVRQFLRDCCGMELLKLDTRWYWDDLVALKIENLDENQRQRIREFLGIKSSSGVLGDLIRDLPKVERRKVWNRLLTHSGEIIAGHRKLMRKYPGDYREFKDLYYKAYSKYPDEEPKSPPPKKKYKSQKKIAGAKQKKMGFRKSVFAEGVDEVILNAKKLRREEIEGLIRDWSRQKLIDKETAKYIRVRWAMKEKIYLGRTDSDKIIPANN